MRPSGDHPPQLLILGAGPTGLGAAWQLDRARHPRWTVVERNGYVGGLSASFRDAAGFTWDIGGHVLFSHYPEFDAMLAGVMGNGFLTHERRSAIRMLGRYIPYPFQNNIRHLPPEQLERCLRGLEEVAASPRPPDRTNFLTWNLGRFGEGITRLFIQPDNEKRWAAPLEALSSDWVADRVSPVDLERIRTNIRLGRDDVSWGPNNRFLFPREGGTGAIFQRLARPLGERIRLNSEAVEIDPAARRVRLADGETLAYDRLLSTLPIDHLCRILRGLPPALAERAGRLRHADGYIVGIGIRQPCPTDKGWVYCPERAAPFFRATFFSNYSPANAPDGGHYSIMCDVSHSPERPVCKETVVNASIQGLIQAGLLAPGDRRDIVSTFLIDAPHTYPVPTLERDVILDALHDHLEPLGIASRGRFGAWLYEIGNMDHCVMMGRQWAEAQLRGGRESVWLDRR